MNGCYLINQSHVRQFALEIAQRNGRRFTRVSGKFLTRIESHLKQIIVGEVHRAPSLGVTLK